jgi:hypothetical protein
MEAAAAGAQTERPGLAEAGEGFAWRQDLTGHLVSSWCRQEPIANPGLVPLLGKTGNTALRFVVRALARGNRTG